jgi:hypothetical protein
MPRKQPPEPIVPGTPMELEYKMDYAIRLADPEWPPEYEDLLKLVSLLKVIEELLSRGITASPGVDAEFRRTVKAFFKARGAFRAAVQPYPYVKEFIRRM